MYSQFYDNAQGFVTLNEFRSDNFTFYQYVESSYSNNDFTIWDSPLWGNLYKLVFLSNQVVNNLQDIEIDNKDQYLAEAMFMRGYAYFWLVRSFGEVPIILKTPTIEESLNVKRAATADVYALIEKDLQFAVSKLPENSPKGRANKYVAETILASVYITQGGYPINKDKYKDAVPLLEDIIKSGKYKLEESYADIFSLEGENGQEVIWSAVMDPNQKGHHHDVSYMLNPTVARATCTPEFAPGEDPNLGNLWLSFEPGDLRRDVSLDNSSQDNSGNIQNQVTDAKYEYGYIQGIGWTSDYILERYAGVLLLYAEALDKTGHTSIIEDKWGIINRIRDRAGLGDISTGRDFMEALMEERRHEFVWEGVRWFDLVRTNTFVEKLKNVQHANAADFWKLLPIPVAEMDKMGGKWQNNEGY